MRSQRAKAFVADLEARRTAGQSMHEQLQQAHKQSKTAGSAAQKQDERERLITQFVAQDAAMPPDLFKLALYFLALFIYMCRLPFSIVSNFHFMRFLWVLRPNFAKQLVPRSLRDLLANDLLDEAYEEAQEVASKALAEVPGRLTLGMDGHKEAKHRHVETITKAKLGISTFAAAEYMKTTRTTGKNLSSVALKYLTP
eukprot:5907541-Prymnesium_polylepis.1